MRMEGGSGLGAARATELGRQLFYKVDEDRNGVLSKREVRDSGLFRKLGVAMTAQDEKAKFDEADVNKDGVLSRHEGEALITAAVMGNPMAAIAAMLMTRDLQAFPYAQEAPGPAASSAEDEAEAAEDAPPAHVNAESLATGEQAAADVAIVRKGHAAYVAAQKAMTTAVVKAALTEAVEPGKSE